MKALWLRFFVVILIFCLCIPCVSVSAASAVSFSMSCTGDVYYGGEFILKIAVAKPSTALSGLEFNLSYNPDYVTPVVTENNYENREMDVFFAAKPTGWEQFSRHDANNSKYTLRFAMGESGSVYLNQANQLILEIPFVVRTPGSFDFDIDAESIIAIGSDSALTTYGGLGQSLTVTAESGAEKIAVSLSGNSSATKGDEYSLNVAVENIGDVAGIVAVEFNLLYNPTLFEPIINSNDNSQMDEFLVSSPSDGWEQMCRLHTAEGKYVIRLAAKNCDDPDKAEILKSSEKIILSIPFKAVGAVGSKADFSISSSSVVGVNNVMGVLSGVGNSKVVEIIQATPVIPPATSPEELGYVIENGCLLSLREYTKIGDFLAPFATDFKVYSGNNEITDGYVGTGYILKDGKGNSYTIVVKGDVDGSGVIDFFDCLYTKAIYNNNYLPNYAERYAAIIDGGNKVTLFDYLQIKSHYFGRTNLYE